MIYKKDFKPLISEIKQRRLKAKRNVKDALKDSHIDYGIEARALQERAEAEIFAFTLMLNRMNEIFKNRR